MLARPHKSADRFNLVLEHLSSEAGIGAQEDGSVHDLVGSGHFADDAEGIGAVFFKLHEDGLAQEVATEKHAIPDFVGIKVTGEIGVAERGARFDPHHKTKPGGVGLAAGGVPLEGRAERKRIRASATFGGRNPPDGVRGQGELKHVIKVGEADAEGFPVLLTRFDEGGELFELLTADGGLRVERLQVITEVAVDVFVIVAFGEFAELPAEAFVAGVVLAGGAPAVAAPIPEALGVGLERGTADDVDRPTLTHGEVVRGIEGLGGNVAPGAGIAGDVDTIRGNAGRVLRDAERLGARDGHGVGAAESIAVVLDEPKVVLAAKLQHGTEIEGIAEGVGDHHGLGLAGDVGGLELVGADVAGGGVVVDEDGNRAELDDGGDGRGKPGGHGDNFVAVPDAFVLRQLVRGEGGEGDEVGRRAGIDQQAVLHAKQAGEFLFEGLALGPEGQPKIQRGANGGLDLVLIEHSAGVGDGLAGLPGGVRGIVTRALSGMHERGVLAGEAEDLGLDVCGIGHWWCVCERDYL